MHLLDFRDAFGLPRVLGLPESVRAVSTTTTSAESPDHRVYDVNTAITAQAGSTYQIKITVVQHGTSEVLAQETSEFSSAGQSVGG